MSDPHRSGDEESPRVVIRDKRRIDPTSGAVREPVGEYLAGSAPAEAAPGASEGPADPSTDPAPEAASDGELAERLADLQRVTAEYANYRRRVERDRVAVVELAQARIFTDLLPVLDDVERAREHGDLGGAFKSVADVLSAALTRHGLESFGTVGDAFDPAMHEAVMHSTSPDVDGPTCVAVMRQGYRQGERVLRPAMVAVADRQAEPTSAS